MNFLVIRFCLITTVLFIQSCDSSFVGGFAGERQWLEDINSGKSRSSYGSEVAYRATKVLGSSHDSSLRNGKKTAESNVISCRDFESKEAQDLKIYGVGECPKGAKDERTGITIQFRVNEEMFPKSWETAEINAKGASLDKLEFERNSKLINIALNKYPAALLMNNLREIYILKSLEVAGYAYGGTASWDIVYIADGEVEDLFHHEFSHVLLLGHPDKFNKKEWESLNEMSYGSGGFEALKDLSKSESWFERQIVDRTFNSKGFLTQYASSAFEEDVATFAENLFLPNCQRSRAIKANVKLAEKQKLVIEFYNSLDEIFTKEYFEGLLNTKCIAKNRLD